MRTRSAKLNRQRHIKSRYGITLEMHDWLLEQQGGVCALCGHEEKASRAGKIMNLGIDHAHKCECDHPSLKGCVHCVRGLVCNACNRAILPWVERSMLLQARFADYLENRPLSGKVFPEYQCDVNERYQRQLKVVSLRKRGLTFKEIADELDISRQTATRDWQASE